MHGIYIKINFSEASPETDRETNLNDRMKSLGFVFTNIT
jgi:hypothetical protein